MLASLGIQRFVVPRMELYESAAVMFRRYKADEADTWP